MRTLWHETARMPTFGPLPGDRSADVVVVGAGIAGITAAHMLQAAGRAVVLVDAGQPGCGETGHTSAHVTAIQDVRFSEIVSRMGRDRAREVATAGQAAIDVIEALAEDAAFERVPGFIHAEEEKDVESLEVEARTARGLGLDATFVRDVPLPFPVAGAVRFERQAQFDPLRYLAPIVARIPRGDSAVHGDTRVLDVEEGRRGCTVRTERGSIRCRQVLVLTHAPLKRVLIHTRVTNHRTYVIAGVVAGPDAPLAGLFFDTASPYHYVRTQRVGDRHVLLAGGEDHLVGDVRDTSARLDRLERWTRERFPLREVTHRWSGQVVDSVDMLPFIGRERRTSRVLIGTGFTGTGMVNGTLAAMILTDLVLGRRSRWAETFSLQRVKLRAQARELVQHNLHAARRFAADWLAPSEARSLAEVPRGEARITNVRGRRLAVFRDDGGQVHAVSPLCTHLGCRVRWNGGARSWDCPCHGSRFDVDGRVLHGPAVKALERIDVEEIPAEVGPADEPGPRGS